MLRRGARLFYPVLLAALLVNASTPSADVAPTPQPVPVPIEPYEIESTEKLLIEKASALKEAGKLMARGKVVKALRKPSPEKITLPAVATQILRPREVAAKARAALMRVGWFYKCKECDDWHVSLAGGFAISTDGAVVTCYHCIPPEDLDMREGFLIASDAAGEVYPVRAIIAADEAMDAAIVRVSGGPFTALPLNDAPAPGDAAFCFSDPLGMAGYFSAGIVNRFFWSEGTSGDINSLEGARRLRLHVSTDWAPGSSGAAVLDDCGNAIGHVCSIQSLFSEDDPEAEPPAEERNDADPEAVESDKIEKTEKRERDKEKEEKRERRREREKPDEKPAEKTEPPAPMITLHEAIPVKALKVLIDRMNK